MFFKSSIRSKILTGYMCVVLLVGLMVVVTITSQTRTSNSLLTFADISVRKGEAAHRIHAAFEVNRRFAEITTRFTQAIDTESGAPLGELPAIQARVEAFIEGTFTNGPVDSSVARLFSAFTNRVELGAAFVNTYLNDPSAVSEGAVAEYEEMIRSFQARLDAHQSESVRKMEETFDEISTATERLSVSTRWVMHIVTILAVLTAFVVGIGYHVARKAIDPVGELVLVLKNIAQGEGSLTERLDASSNDEVGELASWFNTFLDKLQMTINDIAINTVAVSTASQSLYSISGDMATQSRQVKEQSNMASEGGRQLSTSITSLAANADEISASANTVTSAIEELSSSLHEVAKNCEDESKIAERANAESKVVGEMMADLGDSAQKISKVVDVINAIASQTNLLALNATIEAASAGEAGKGFAVVANEVKELARQSAEATEEIVNQIAEMQASTKAAIAAIKGITAIVEDAYNFARANATAVEEQSITTSEISRNVSHAAQAIQEMAQRIEEAANGANEVSENIGGISASAERTADGAEQTNTNADELAKLAEQLRAIVAQFNAQG